MIWSGCCFWLSHLKAINCVDVNVPGIVLPQSLPELVPQQLDLQ